MAADITTSQVWKAIEAQTFGVLGLVTSRNEARTVGIVYTVHDGKLYIGTSTDSWKVRHAQSNANVSVTIPIAKRIPFLPWIQIPAATVSFSGDARVLPLDAVDPEVSRALFQVENLPDADAMSLIEVQPRGTFLTYGIGVSLMKMRDPTEARGRAPVR